MSRMERLITTEATGQAVRWSHMPDFGFRKRLLRWIRLLDLAVEMRINAFRLRSFNKVEVDGLEPTTLCLQSRCSPN